MSGRFTYEYELGGECFELDVEWEQTGSARRATRYDPPEFDEVEFTVYLDGNEIDVSKEAYAAITGRAYEELEHEQEVMAGYDEDHEYERHRQKELDDE